jgi:nitrite reductase/ring-hydroxylating ferredoxin subunit
MEGFTKICRVSDLPNKRGKKFTISDDFDIAVFRVADKIYAVSNVCPHNHSEVMYDGYLDEELYLACPIHGWQFHLKQVRYLRNAKDSPQHLKLIT